MVSTNMLQCKFGHSDRRCIPSISCVGCFASRHCCLLCPFAELGYRPVRAAAAGSGVVAGFGSPLPSPSVSPTAAAAAGAAKAEAAAMGAPAASPGLPMPQLWQPIGQVAGVSIIGGTAALQPSAATAAPPVSGLVKAEQHASRGAGLTVGATAVKTEEIRFDPSNAANAASMVPVNGRKEQSPEPQRTAAAEQQRNGANGRPQSHPLDLPKSPPDDRPETAPPQKLGLPHVRQQSSVGAEARLVATYDHENAAATLATAEAAAIAAMAESRVLSGVP